VSRPSPFVVTLTATQRRVLEGRLRRPTAQQREVVRARIVLAAAGLTPKACRPYRAKTKGKVERVIRELKEDFLRWLTGQVLPRRPSIVDYDRLARRWCTEVVAERRHRTTGRIVSEAWAEERQHLRAIPPRLLVERSGAAAAAPVIDLAEVRRAGDEVEARSLSDYEAVL
jgi:hypothetical protein